MVVTDYSIRLPNTKVCMGRNLEYDQHICTQRRYLGHFRRNLNIVRVSPRPPSSHVDTLPHVADRGRRARWRLACLQP